MTTRRYAVTLIVSSLLSVVILAVGSPGDGETQGPTSIDCRYENPELKAYANQIPSCAP